MKRFLKDISEIRTGYNSRSSSCIGVQDVCIVSAKNLSDNFAGLEMFLIPASYNGYLREGDILVKSRGPVFEAKVFDIHDNLNKYIAANTLLIVRLKTNRYKSAYVAQIINSDGAQQHLRALSFGQTVPTLSPASLGSLVCPEIPVEKQEEIEVVTKAIDDYRITLVEYCEKQEKLMKALKNELMKGVK